ncbi:2-phospho-L-lactate guanylyltransferase [Methanolapillus ohkumae]|uniref:2-phospho-L-lactate guanylyltransferase n=1 Tax=Methanolapillus ohkumae TaxID=3028298 RepID=A0AA96V786_9EURY|nr:Phosphoenolpyruvate guanylyltransferase [Methanosarcinaceae archaeon Am2]
MIPRVLIPLRPDNPKSRLSPVLSEEERQTLFLLMLEHVVSVLKRAGISQLDLLSTTALSKSIETSVLSLFCDSGNGSDGGNGDSFASFLTDERDLNSAVNAYLKKSAAPILIVMADLALLRPENILQMVRPPVEKSQVYGRLIRVAPGKGGGTNMIFIGAPDVFDVKYHGQSFKKHVDEAQDLGLCLEIYDSFYASIDIDEPGDLTELLIHGEGPLREFADKTLSLLETNGRNRFEHKK